MKERLESPREFGGPAESVSRAVALATIAAALSFLLVVAGVIAWQPGWAVAGLGGFTIAWAARWWLQRGEISAAERLVADVLSEGYPVDEEKAEKLLQLLEEWEEAEAKRGTAEFDPWALQTLRNDIRRVVESERALEELFDRLRQAD